MKSLTTATITLLSFLTTPTLAANFYCPGIQPLPQTLNIRGTSPAQPELRQFQAYLTNLRNITAAYQNRRTEGGRNQVTNCLVEHLANLADNYSLLYPATPADAATWQLLHAEVENTLRIAYPNLRFKPELPFIGDWLAYTPRQVPATPATTVATR